MMVVDTSVLMAVLNGELEAAAFPDVMLDDGQVLVSIANAAELMIVATGRSDSIYQSAVEFLGRPFIRPVPLDEEQLWIAAAAYRRFGKGRGHSAGLNFGDTFTYALAAARGLPLLFKGDDFARTGIAPAALPP